MWLVYTLCLWEQYMPRVAVALSCSQADFAELQRITRSRSGEVRMAERANIVLKCLSGMQNADIASEMGLRPNTVGQWRKRFAEEGIEGLRDKPRSGKPVNMVLRYATESLLSWNSSA